MPDIAHDAKLSEVYIYKAGQRYRVYRGDTAAHIAWKVQEHAADSPEVIIVGDPKQPAEISS